MLQTSFDSRRECGHSGFIFFVGGCAGPLRDGSTGLLGVAGLGWACGRCVGATPADVGKWGKGWAKMIAFLKGLGSCRKSTKLFLGIAGRLEDGFFQGGVQVVSRVG